MGLPPTTRARTGPCDDSGFTLVEAVVALFVLGIIFTALAMASMGSIRASMNSRAEQQAIDFATEALERARQADYYSLSHDATEIATDSANVSPCGTTWCFDPGDGAEPLVIETGGGVNPHTSVISSNVNNGVNFQVSTYVTKPAGTSADYKRVTVVTRWTIGTKSRERKSSSIVTATSRGLPIPQFTFKTASATHTVNREADSVFKIEMTNQGAPDRWDLTTSSGTWSFWQDNGDSILCMVAADCGAGVPLDAQMVDGDDAGSIVDTGRLDPTSSIVFWAVRDGSSNGTVGDYWTTLTATAVSVDHAGVTAGVGVKTIQLLTRVTDQVVTQSPGPVTPTPVAPSAPQAFTVTVGDGQLTANWLTPAQAGTAAITDYKIEYRRANEQAWTTESDTSTALSLTITGLTNGVEYDVRVAAVSAAGTSTYVSQLATPTAATSYVAPSICATSSPSSLPAAQAASGYTLRNYTLHNRSGANPGWPGTGAPSPTSTLTQGVPLAMAMDAPQFAPGTTLPVYSSDIVSDTGRVILSGGSFTSADSATTQFVDWRTSVGAKNYKGDALLTLWVAPGTGGTGMGFNLGVQLYRSKASDTSMGTDNTQDLDKNQPNSPVYWASASWCGGPDDWQKVGIKLPIETKNALSGDEFLGVRVWNEAGGSYATRVRVGYDVANDAQGKGFPATLILPEK